MRHSKTHTQNFGYGHQMAYAGKNALRTVMPDQKNSIASHAFRWKQFCRWLKASCWDIPDARKINKPILNHYAEYLRARLNGQGKALSVAYGQNLLSSCNVVLAALRNDTLVSIRPAEALQAKRSAIRDDAPVLDRQALHRAQAFLQPPPPAGTPSPRDRQLQQQRAVSAVVLGLARELGLRTKETVLMDTHLALEQAQTQGRVQVREGTKGGCGKRIERWVPVTDTAMAVLQQATKLQGRKRNLVSVLHRGKPDTAAKVIQRIKNQTQPALAAAGLTTRHDLRAAWACERYEQLTGCPAPVVAGGRLADTDTDHEARLMLSREMGHNRTSVIAEYIGSCRMKAPVD